MFAGPIPTELGQLTRMEYLDLSENKFTGLFRFSAPIGSILVVWYSLLRILLDLHALGVLLVTDMVAFKQFMEQRVPECDI